MANMGYCRWQNTARDLNDCIENGIPDSVSELEAMKRALKYAKELLDMADEDGIDALIDEAKG